MKLARPTDGRLLDQSIGQHGDYAFGWLAPGNATGRADLRVVVRAATSKGADDMRAEETRPRDMPPEWRRVWLYLTEQAELYARSLETVGGRLRGHSQ
jgi:hypothetical protein